MYRQNLIAQFSGKIGNANIHGYTVPQFEWCMRTHKLINMLWHARSVLKLNIQFVEYDTAL